MKKKVTSKYYRNDKLLKKIGKKIREKRLEKDISIETFAYESDIAYTQVAKMERGEVNFNVSYLEKIAKALGIDVRELWPD